MVRKAIVPVPVSGGTGSVFIPATNSPNKFWWPWLNGKCIQVGLIPPSGSPSGSFYVFDNTNFVPISGNFSGSWNWNGVAGLVGDMTVNIVGATINGMYAIIFIFDDGGGMAGR